jgi:hypothetical protein
LTTLGFLPEEISGCTGREISTDVLVFGVMFGVELGLDCDRTGIVMPSIVVTATRANSDRSEKFLMTQRDESQE